MVEGYGYDDIEAGLLATAESPYCIGSVTKGFTSTLIGVLIDESDGL